MKSLEIKEMPLGQMQNKYYPSISVSTKTIPELADLKDGDTCTLEIKVKKTGSNSTNNDTRVHLDVIEGQYAEDDAAEGADEEYA